MAQKTDPNQKKAVFKLRLQRGPTTLQTWLNLKNGKSRGAFFAYVRRLPD